MKEKYGVTFSSQRANFSKLVKKTNLKKFGVEAPIQNPQIKEKIKQTNLEKYGVENPSSVTRDKALATMIEKYGCHSSQSDEVKRKYIETSLERYGVTHPMLNEEIFDKCYKNARWYKKFEWSDGTIVDVQGNEPIVLKELNESGYNSENVKTSTKDMPKIIYEFEGKTHRYYPDIFIPKENLIIEVKSEYTLNKDLDRNKAKFQAVKDAGFEFRLEVR